MGEIVAKPVSVTADEALDLAVGHIRKAMNLAEYNAFTSEEERVDLMIKETQRALVLLHACKSWSEPA